MSERATQLQVTADAQLEKLIELVSTLDTATLWLPCPGREAGGRERRGAHAAHRRQLRANRSVRPGQRPAIRRTFLSKA